jgi:predicted RNA-binding protein
MKLRRLLISTVVAGGLLLLAAPLPAHAASAGTPPATTTGRAGPTPTAGLTAQRVDGPYPEHSYLNDRCLDADLNTIGGNGTKAQLWDCLGSGQLNQYWWFETTSVPDAYRIRSRYNFAKCLDADLNTIGGNGTKVQLWDCLGDGQTNQLWSFTPTKFGGVSHLVSRYNGRCLDADLNTIGGNGTKVQLWDCLGDDWKNQDWYIEIIL